MNRVCALDVNQLPLCPLPPPSNAARQNKFGEKTPTEVVDPIWFQRFPQEDAWLSVRTDFVSIKAPLVIYMLDRRMGKGFLQKSITKIMVSTMSGELQSGLSTQNWLKVCRKVSEKTELRQFADQWIYGSGCPKFSIKYKFNRKKMMVEVNFRQENSNLHGVSATRKFTYSDAFFVSALISALSSSFTPIMRRPAAAQPKASSSSTFSASLTEYDSLVEVFDPIDEIREELPKEKEKEAPLEIDMLTPDERFFFLETVEEVEQADPSSYIRYHVAKSLASFALTLASNHATRMKDFEASQTQEPGKDAQIQEGIQSSSLKLPKRDPTDFDRAKEIFKIPEVSSRLWFLLKATKEIRVKAHLLRVCEQLYEPFPEPVKIPPTPPQVVIEQQVPVEPIPKPKLVIRMSSTPSVQLTTLSESKAEAHSVNSLKREAEGDDLSVAKKPKLQREESEVIKPPGKIPPETPKPKPRLDASQPKSKSERVTADPAFVNRCKSFLTKLRNHPSSAPFVLPVDDSVAPNYSEIIKKPMDLSTAQKKLEGGRYRNDIGLFFDDIRLIFSNCFKYNAEFSPVYKQAKKLESFFNDIMIYESPAEKDGIAQKPINTSLKKIWKTMTAKPEAAWFMLPVDPIALNLPTYFDIIKQPMDFSTLKSSLKEGKIKSLEEFVEKGRLIFQNATKFNPPQTQVHQDALKMLKAFDQEVRTSENASGLSSISTSAKPSDGTASKTPERRPKDELKSSKAPTKEDTLSFKQFAKDDAKPHKMLKDDTKSVKIPTKEDGKSSKLSGRDAAKTPGMDDMKPSKILIKSDANPVKTPAKEEVKLKVPIKLAHPSLPPPQSSSISETKKKPDKPTGSLSPSDAKRCFKLVKRLQQNKHASVFLLPVDPIALGIPEYTNIVKHPMDLSTIQKKLEGGQYASSGELKADVELFLDDWVYAQGKELEAFFKGEWSAAFNPHERIETKAKEEKSGGQSDISTIIQKLRAHPDALIFLEPVDPTLYPDYYVKIQNPIDLRAILTKANEGGYKDLKQLEADVRLMVLNCFTYNAKNSFGYKAGASIDKYFKRLVDPNASRK
ncbi:hypothetical protein HDU67_007077 [Dinochytrium kinnereticum]|nr:hypothetical protein HDU67_007077 [Dinochytrium kinnereticum]